MDFLDNNTLYWSMIALSGILSFCGFILIIKHCRNIYRYNNTTLQINQDVILNTNTPSLTPITGYDTEIVNTPNLTPITGYNTEIVNTPNLTPITGHDIEIIANKIKNRKKPKLSIIYTYPKSPPTTPHSSPINYKKPESLKITTNLSYCEKPEKCIRDNYINELIDKYIIRYNNSITEKDVRIKYNNFITPSDVHQLKKDLSY